MERIDLGLKHDHVGGGFEWEREPCCDLLKAAVDDERFVFVSNFVGGPEKSNSFYIMALDADGGLARSNGLAIAHCPWCGAQINARKHYPEK